jgi:hypothetical protein
MLSLFPELLFLAPFSGLLMRIALGFVFGVVAWERMRNDKMSLKILGCVDALLAVFFIIGLYAQAAALAGFICTLVWLFVPAWRPLPLSTTALVNILALSLLVTGPGPFAFDLPL